MLDRAGDPAGPLVDRQEGDLDVLARRVLLGAVELALGHHREHAGDDLDEEIVRRDLHDLGDQLVALEELIGVLDPRIGQRVLERERDLLRLGIELHHLDRDGVADLDDLGRVLDARVRELAVVDEAVDSAEVDERAELGEPHDDAVADLSDLQRSEQLLLLRVELFFEHLALREHDAMPLVIEVDDLEPQLLPDELVEVADGLTADLRGGDEPAHPEIDEDAALHDLRDRCFDHFVVLVRFDHLFPGLQRACAALAEIELAVLLVDPMDHHLELIADAQFLRFDRERELAERQDALGLAADVNEQFVLIFCDDDAGEDLAFVENLEALFVEALLECELILFFGWCRRLRRDSGGNSFVLPFL